MKLRARKVRCRYIKNNLWNNFWLSNRKIKWGLVYFQIRNYINKNIWFNFGKEQRKNIFLLIKTN